VRREAFEAVGGFDESFFMYFEDIDLCERLAVAGWDVVYAPSAVVEHHGAHSTSRNLRLRLAVAGWDVVYAPSAVVEHHGAHSTSRNLRLMSRPTTTVRTSTLRGTTRGLLGRLCGGSSRRDCGRATNCHAG